ncbi:MAG: osmoprotectant transport system substrate-binding protein [Actinomycetota bacterium]|nr:osmoprotectant transport system substrate-binding protein [Actinomycetota bacterium]
MRTSPRALRALVLAACLAIVLAACGSSGSSGGGANSTTPSGSGATIASTLVLGGAPECPQRPFCLIGLKKTYGLTFKSFKPLDAGGPLTVAALGQNKIQIGELFTTSGVIASKGWVLLQDDKKLQPADNVTPVLRNDIVAAYGKAMTDLVNGVSAKLTTEILTDLNKQTDIDQKDPEAVAKSWLESNNLIPASKVAAKSGPTIVVGSAKFTEDETLADVYADMLKANGYPVSKKLNIGSREIYFPALKNNQISFLPEYAGSLLTFLDPKKPATTNPATNAAQLAAVLKPLKLTALQPSTAEDVNGFVVTKSTADKYKLVNMSDLAKPAP